LHLSTVNDYIIAYNTRVSSSLPNSNPHKSVKLAILGLCWN
jgi:hypothetical protein